MEFYEKLKVARERAGLTQAELAKITGITTRTIQNYELGASTPRTLEVLVKLSDVLGLTPSSLMGNSETSVAFEHEKGGPKAARDVNELVSEITSLFSNEKIDETKKDAVMAALSEAYWKAKMNRMK